MPTRPQQPDRRLAPRRLGERRCSRIISDDLVADRVHGRQRGHRLLEDHGDARCRGSRGSPRCSASAWRGRSPSRRGCASRISPATIRPGSRTSFRIDQALIDLPQPDSPTTDKVLPRRSTRSSAVDRLHHALAGEEIGLQVRAPRAAMSATSPASTVRIGIGRVAQAVAEEVQGEHRRDDREAGEEQPRRGRHGVMFCASLQQDAPADTTGGCRPMPRKESAVSARIIAGIASVIDGDDVARRRAAAGA